MIRLILSKVDNKYFLDILDTTNGSKLNVTSSEDFFIVAANAISSLLNWKEKDNADIPTIP